MWATTTTVRIVNALLYPLNRDGLLWVGTAMATVEDLPTPINQQGIDRIETLLDDLDEIETKIAVLAPKAGRTKLDVIEWSDKPGQVMAGVYQQRERIRSEISSLLGLVIYGRSAVGQSGNILSRS